MKSNAKQRLESQWLIMMLWGVTILSPVVAGAYAFRHRESLTSRARLDLNCLIQAEPSESELKLCLAKDQAIIDAMMGDTLLVKTPPQTNPVTEVDIIGQEVLVNGKLYSVGDHVDDAEITAITARYVTVQWNGTSTTFSPINGQEQAGGSRGLSQYPRRSSPRSSTSRKRPKRSEARSVRTKPSREGKRIPTPEKKERPKKMPPAEKKATKNAERKNLKKMPSQKPKVPKKARARKK
ncbi:MAG: hypothetical protein GY809_04470 [Planctomycetes bacterium]|nr:hypothetical protein [Planctomycetota bacterium]